MPQQMALRVLLPCRPEVGAHAIERHLAQGLGPTFHGQATQEREAAAVQHFGADPRQPRAQPGQRKVTRLQMGQVTAQPRPGGTLDFINILRVQRVHPVLASLHVRSVPDRRAFKQWGQSLMGACRWFDLHAATIGRARRR